MLQAAVASKRKLGMDMLHEYAMVFGQLAMKYQPIDGNQHANAAEFERWAKLSMEAAALKAPFETPRLKAVAVAAIPPEPMIPVAAPRDESVIDAISPQEAYRVAMNLAPEVEGAEIVPLKKKRRA